LTADAGAGLAEFLGALFRRAATDRGITEVVERARSQGRLRAGVEAGDIPVLMLMVGSVADFAAGTNPELWERYSMLLIESVVPSGDTAAWHGTALTRAQLTEARAEWHPRPARLPGGKHPGTSKPTIPGRAGPA
jgi:hypothetical protein